LNYFFIENSTKPKPKPNISERLDHTIDIVGKPLMS
jgi:hypothetical protein